MDLRRLEAFVHVAEHGSFTRAAELLQTDQPALSRLVRSLEVELHHTLLVRNGRGAVPTPAGELLLMHAREILQQAQRARDAMHKLHESGHQKFTLGLVYNIAQFAVLSLVRELRGKFPHAAIQVVEGLSTNLLEALLMGRVDAAIMYETPRSDLVDTRTLMREELYFVSPGSPSPGKGGLGRIRFRDAVRFPLISTGRTHAIREVIEAAAAQQRVKLKTAIEVDDVTALLDLIEEGYGHALLPKNALVRDDRRRALTVSRITDPALHCKLVVATSRTNPPTGLSRSALSLVEELIVPLYVAQDALHTFGDGVDVAGTLRHTPAQ